MPDSAWPSEIALAAFLAESNLIEGIANVSSSELEAAMRFLRLFQVHVETLNLLQAVITPGKPLRKRSGMDVRVGSHRPPPGGPKIPIRLQSVLMAANAGADPWRTHLDYEDLHPYMDGNGRTGRLLWAWQMHAQEGQDPFALGFLHRFYYQTLAKARGETDAG